MNSQKEAKQQPLSVEQLNDLIVDSIQDIKGEKIVKLDLRHLDDAPTEFFIICEGNSNTQVKAISDNIYKFLSFGSLKRCCLFCGNSKQSSFFNKGKIL